MSDEPQENTEPAPESESSTPYHIGHVISDHAKDAIGQLKAKVTGQTPPSPQVKWASKHQVRQRLLICFHCDKLIHKTGQCRLCNCFMNAKAKYAKASCPLEKW